MARPLRIQFPDAWYHVMNRGRRGDLIFKDKGDYYAFIDLLKDCFEMWNIRVVAYCLMGNHYHILLQTPDANLSRCMRHINGVYTHFIQKRHVEVPESKALAPDFGQIKETVCRSYGVKEEDLFISRRGISNEPRNVAILLLRNLKGSKLHEIGREFDIDKYSSVSTIIERTKQRAIKDRKFKKRIEEIKLDLKMSQEQT